MGEDVLVWEPHGGGYSGGQRPTPVSGHLSEPEQKRAGLLAGLNFSGAGANHFEVTCSCFTFGLLTVLGPSRAHLSGTIG